MQANSKEAVYEVVRAGDGWMVRHDGEASMVYATREAAFEAAVPAASLAIKQGFSVRIEVAEPATGDTVQ